VCYEQKQRNKLPRINSRPDRHIGGAFMFAIEDKLPDVLTDRASYILRKIFSNIQTYTLDRRISAAAEDSKKLVGCVAPSPTRENLA